VGEALDIPLRGAAFVIVDGSGAGLRPLSHSSLTESPTGVVGLVHGRQPGEVAGYRAAQGVELDRRSAPSRGGGGPRCGGAIQVPGGDLGRVSGLPPCLLVCLFRQNFHQLSKSTFGI
jgi:hypothetical protein